MEATEAAGGGSVGDEEGAPLPKDKGVCPRLLPHHAHEEIGCESGTGVAGIGLGAAGAITLPVKW